MNTFYLSLFALLLPLLVWAEAKEPGGKIKNVLLIMSDDLKASVGNKPSTDRITGVFFISLDSLCRKVRGLWR